MTSSLCSAMVVGETKGMNGVKGGGGDEEGLEFETTRIEVLKEERSQIQKKTFTKWVNSNLKKKKVRFIRIRICLGCFVHFEFCQ